MAGRGREPGPRIVAAVAASANVAGQGDPDLAKALNNAVNAALKKALEEGVSVYDAPEIHKRTAAARAQAKADYYKQ